MELSDFSSKITYIAELFSGVSCTYDDDCPGTCDHQKGICLIEKNVNEMGDLFLTCFIDLMAPFLEVLASGSK